MDVLLQVVALDDAVCLLAFSVAAAAISTQAASLTVPSMGQDTLPGM